MRFLLFVEGPAEAAVLPEFLARWLNVRLAQSIGIKPVKFQGWADMLKEAPKKAKLYLSDPRTSSEILAIIGLVDLQGPQYPANVNGIAERETWIINEFENKVGQNKYKQFAVIHELEAWILSDPRLLPTKVREAIPTNKAATPEKINFDCPPKALLESLYGSKLGKDYKEVTDGTNLFRKLDPEIAYNKCPSLQKILNAMLAIAGGASKPQRS